MCACRVGKVVCACRVGKVVCACRVGKVVCACRVVEVVCACYSAIPLFRIPRFTASQSSDERIVNFLQY